MAVSRPPSRSASSTRPCNGYSSSTTRTRGKSDTFPSWLSISRPGPLFACGLCTKVNLRESSGSWKKCARLRSRRGRSRWQGVSCHAFSRTPLGTMAPRLILVANRGCRRRSSFERNAKAAPDVTDPPLPRQDDGGPYGLSDERRTNARLHPSFRKIPGSRAIPSHPLHSGGESGETKRPRSNVRIRACRPPLWPINGPGNASSTSAACWDRISPAGGPAGRSETPPCRGSPRTSDQALRRSCRCISRCRPSPRPRVSAPDHRRRTRSHALRYAASW
jgi:hypothetical protein